MPAPLVPLSENLRLLKQGYVARRFGVSAETLRSGEQHLHRLVFTSATSLIPEAYIRALRASMPDQWRPNKSSPSIQDCLGRFALTEEAGLLVAKSEALLKQWVDYELAVNRGALTAYGIVRVLDWKISLGMAQAWIEKAHPGEVPPAVRINSREFHELYHWERPEGLQSLPEPTDSA